MTKRNDPKSPKGYVYKYKKISEIGEHKPLMDNDVKGHTWPIISDGEYKGYIGLGGYVMCKIKL